ncbi:beta-glucosidase/6-phospho-beta-glucosidase/beta-galactosidase [Rhodoligotrophos appendicifer]|uniref:beta-glucosidase n=1 Tax=Rhodoligotrophos appendicifer TaxID=987056 RepID=UPI001FE317FB|nr:beta-glucosidase [Rhodoligotrophos appendicifer]
MDDIHKCDRRLGPFKSFFWGGFECSSHRRSNRRRLDLLASTGHDQHVLQDYLQLRSIGIVTVRDGLRWHLIERRPGRYDWSSALPMLRAASSSGMQVIWDLCHYGWPDHIDIWSEEFVERFAAFCGASAKIVADSGEASPFYCPVNEISFWSWAGGDKAQMNPSTRGRGGELKRQLVRATIAAIKAIRNVEPRARFITAEPLIHVAPRSLRPKDVTEAKTYRDYQFEATDLIAGLKETDLGGSGDCLDIIGLNYYPHNQWTLDGSTIPLGHHAYIPLHELLLEAHERYGRPLVIAETGAEGSARAAWLHYVCGEVELALAGGAEIWGVCLYPVLDYPGWENDRICKVGLLSALDVSGERLVYDALARELQRQRQIFEPGRLLGSRHG